MKKRAYTILVLAVAIGVWQAYKIFSQKYHNVKTTSNIVQQKYASDNGCVGKIEPAKAISYKESKEYSLCLSNSITKSNQCFESDSKQKSERVDPPILSKDTTSKYDPDLENLVLSEYTDLKRKADPMLITEYSIMLVPKENWLTEFRINGDSLSEKAFSKIISKLKNDGMTALEMQGACITAITCVLDNTFLEAFYQSAGIPHFDSGLFSKTIKVLPDNTHLICFTTKENNYGVSRYTQKFYVSSLVYEKEPEIIVNNFQEQAIEAVKVMMAKKFLLNKLSPNDAELLRQKNSFWKADLVRLLRSKYKTTVYVPDYMPWAMLPKAIRLSSEGVSLRPRWQN